MSKRQRDRQELEARVLFGMVLSGESFRSLKSPGVTAAKFSAAPAREIFALLAAYDEEEGRRDWRGGEFSDWLKRHRRGDVEDAVVDWAADQHLDPNGEEDLHPLAKELAGMDDAPPPPPYIPPEPPPDVPEEEEEAPAATPGGEAAGELAGWKAGEGGVYAPTGELLAGMRLDGDNLLFPDGTQVGKQLASRLFDFGPPDDPEERRANPRPRPEWLVEDILRRQEFTIESGPSKTYKSLKMSQKALCMAGGVGYMMHTSPSPIPGYSVKRCRVLYMNFELSPATWDWRIAKQAAGLKIPPGALRGWFFPWHGRGKGLRIEELVLAVKMLAVRVGVERFDVIFLDPLYTLLAGKEENKAGEMSLALEVLQQLTAADGLAAAVVAAHHFAKGDSSNKDQIDRASGSGVFARLPDNIGTATPLRNKTTKKRTGVVEWELTRRDGESPKPFFFKLNPETLLLDPCKGTGEETGGEEDYLEHDWVDLFDDEGQTFSRATLIALGEKRRWGKKTTLGLEIKVAAEIGILAKTGKRNKDPYGLGEEGKRRWRERHEGRDVLQGIHE